MCSGNTCRSPLAEVLARAEAQRLGLSEVESRSAGTFAWPGQPAAVNGTLVARDHGLDLSGHASAQLDFELLAWADLTLGMTSGHVAEARRIHPAASVRLMTDVLPVDHPEHGRGVADPYGGTRDAYEAAYRLLSTAIRNLFEDLHGG